MQTIIDINGKYFGPLSAAMVRFGHDFDVYFGDDDFRQRLEETRQLLGPEFETLALYPGISTEAVNRLRGYLDMMHSGKKVDLCTILL